MRKLETVLPSVTGSADGGSSSRRIGIAGAFTGIAVVGMLVSGASADTAIEWGAKIFGTAYLAEVILHSPLLIAWVVSRYERLIERDKLDTATMYQEQFTLPKAKLVEPVALPRQRNELASKSFIPPISEDEYIQAGAYIRALYSRDGEPNPAMVHLGTKDESQNGRLRYAAPSEPALGWLVKRNILQPITRRGEINGYRLNLIAAPTWSTASRLLQEPTFFTKE